ncbi:YceD family protein [Stagnimonas aquatica]|nr:YceD family protein [Stagnimonas aquatica]
MRDAGIPLKLDVAEAVARELALQASLPLAELPRLAAALVDADGQLRVALRFVADVQALGRLQGELGGEFRLLCQRCLRPMSWTLDARFDLCLVGSEAEEERLLESCEPVLAEGGQLVLRETLEDEALLALPIAPRCANTDCAARPGETSRPEVGDNDRPGDTRPNPFLALKGKFPAR